MQAKTQTHLTTVRGEKLFDLCPLTNADVVRVGRKAQRNLPTDMGLLQDLIRDDYTLEFVVHIFSSGACNPQYSSLGNLMPAPRDDKQIIQFSSVCTMSPEERELRESFASNSGCGYPPQSEEDCVAFVIRKLRQALRWYRKTGVALAGDGSIMLENAGVKTFNFRFDDNNKRGVFMTLDRCPGCQNHHVKTVHL
jgi:hypothetical protein